jgi:hypothetical protein
VASSFSRRWYIGIYPLPRRAVDDAGPGKTRRMYS